MEQSILLNDRIEPHSLNCNVHIFYKKYILHNSIIYLGTLTEVTKLLSSTLIDLIPNVERSGS